MRISSSSGSTTSPTCGCMGRHAGGDRDERLLLQLLAPRPYTSFILTDAPQPGRSDARPRPVVAVERRSLAVYARLTGGHA